jgi:hypothetical protein
MNRILFLTLMLVCLTLAAKSQNILAGRVLDSLTRAPIPFVNVYFANTTIGTVTNASGEFTIKGFGTGKYILTISFVGYNTVQQPLDFNNNEQRITVNLSQQVIQLKEVSVKADSSDWELYFRFFKENFLGRSKNASQLQILNPKNLRLFYDKEDSVFVAFAKRPIEVENHALGYRIFYQLLDFQIDFKTSRLDYRGIPRFEMLDPKGPRELKKWEAERKRAYYGSFNHLIHALRQNKLEENGFEIHVVNRGQNKGRPSDSYLLERIERLQKKFLALRGSTISRTGIIDSLNYYTLKYREPKITDNVGRQITEAGELFLFGPNNLIRYKGLLEVTFKKEPEENNYTVDMPPLKVQKSTISFLNQIKIYENGYYENVSDVFFDGYMAWSEKLAELLPQEYVPTEQEEK